MSENEMTFSVPLVSCNKELAGHTGPCMSPESTDAAIQEKLAGECKQKRGQKGVNA